MLHTTSRLVATTDGSCPDYTRAETRCPDYEKIKEVVAKNSHGPNTLIPLTVVLDALGLYAALWALRWVPQAEVAERNRIARLFAADCAERVLPLFEHEFPDEKWPRRTIEAARWFAGKPANRGFYKDREAVREEAWEASWATLEKENVETDFEQAARAAYETVTTYAELAAMEAARKAADAVALNAGEEARDAEVRAQIEILRRYLDTTSMDTQPATDGPTPGA
jgi:hypothetical protein